MFGHHQALVLGDDLAVIGALTGTGSTGTGTSCGYGMCVAGFRGAAQPFPGEQDDAVEGEEQRGGQRFGEQCPEGVFEDDAGESDGDCTDDQ